MEEVDKIILQSLRQIDALIDDEVKSLNDFTPELVTRAVSTCLQEINQNTTLPRHLPSAIAQRFSVATTLTEACITAGYRSNIGYQTFLYPNVVEIRRLFMFLIEQLPRVPSTITELAQQSPLREYETLQKEVKSKLLVQLKSPWVPQFARIASRRPVGCSSLTIDFSPQLNLNIPTKAILLKEMQQYFQHLAPNVFQQTALGKYDLISSVLHRNSTDLFTNDEDLESLKFNSTQLSRNKIRKSTAVKNTETPNSTTTVSLPEETTKLSAFDEISIEVSDLQTNCEEQIIKRRSLTSQLNSLREQEPMLVNKLNDLRKEAKVKERSCVVLEEPLENVNKLETLIKSIQDKRKVLEDQWQNYRKPLEAQLTLLQNDKQTKNAQSIKDMKELICNLEEELREKTAVHMQLNNDLKNATLNTAPRKEYTRRIHEFISNIRKQRNDIFKVLDDTRDLQKQINSVSGQLQRQFNYTDDLLFQSAKHDLHAKKAYKLLATLHSNCTELVELVAQTGNITKEIRDLEVQIDNERLKNVANILEQITNDIKKFENLYKDLQAEKSSIGNAITSN